jgi:hypothetical protein
MTYKISQAAAFLYSLDVRQFASGEIKCGRTGARLFDYYKADQITPEQRAKILEWCPDAQFKRAGPAYAPEISHPIVCFPKSAFYRQ